MWVRVGEAHELPAVTWNSRRTGVKKVLSMDDILDTVVGERRGYG